MDIVNLIMAVLSGFFGVAALWVAGTPNKVIQNGILRREVQMPRRSLIPYAAAMAVATISFSWVLVLLGFFSFTFADPVKITGECEREKVCAVTCEGL